MLVIKKRRKKKANSQNVKVSQNECGQSSQNLCGSEERENSAAFGKGKESEVQAIVWEEEPALQVKQHNIEKDSSQACLVDSPPLFLP